jgi:hypothetical protein
LINGVGFPVNSVGWTGLIGGFANGSAHGVSMSDRSGNRDQRAENEQTVNNSEEGKFQNPKSQRLFKSLDLNFSGWHLAGHHRP